MFKYLLAIVSFLPIYIKSQTVTGKIVDEKNNPVVGATINWEGTKKTVTSNATGTFSINKKATYSFLIVSHIGYLTDTINATTTFEFLITLRPGLQTNSVSVYGQKSGTVQSNRSTIKTEILTNVELKKAACCDLAGCFETQSSVQPQTTNVITNSKELRILGLSGVYNQVLIDGFPMIQGLTFTYGISGIPGPFIDNIYISKGANSVLQGFESISGQINVETKKPNTTEKLFANVYMNSFAEKHLNLATNFKQNKWHSSLSFHMVQPAKKVDKDNDKFLDLPLLTRYMLLNKWKKGKESEWGWSNEFAVRYLNEQRVGGQTNFNSKSNKGSNLIYGNTVNINQPEFWAKNNYRFNDKHRLTLYTSAFEQKQASYFGTLAYNAKQTNAFINLQHELRYNTNQSLKSGISYKRLRLSETIQFTDNTLARNYQGNYLRTENIIGVFTENNMTTTNGKLTWMLGIRADHHNNFGWNITPRTLLKYDPTQQLTIRASIGTGWRTVNFFSENVNLLASSRNIIFAEALQPEKAVNMGINVTQKFDKENVNGYLSFDFYKTNFQNQIFPDYDTDPTKAIVKNFSGQSISNGFQSDFFISLYNRFECKLGYNFLDVFRIQNNIKETLPFNARHKFLSTLSYKPPSQTFFADVNIHRYGKQRLPNTASNPLPYQRPDFSEAYTTVNAQVTFVFKKFETYFGCENIFNFRQLQPINSWQNPFGTYFDISSVWGPTRGRELYFGLRWKLK